MSHQTGTIKSFDQATGRGRLSCHGMNGLSFAYSLGDVESHESLTVGEPVCYDLMHGNKTHAEHVRRSIGHIEDYQNLGGLYS